MLVISFKLDPIIVKNNKHVNENQSTNEHK